MRLPRIGPYYSHPVTRRRFLGQSLQAGLTAAMAGPALAASTRNDRPNIVLVSLDTTRADHMSCYGYFRNTTPELAKLAEESVFYTRAVSPSSWTLPAHASLFTGKFVSSHGAQFDSEGPLILSNEFPDKIEEHMKVLHQLRARGLSSDEVTLAAVLSQNGYRTGGVVAGPWMKKAFGLDQGFSFYDDSNITGLEGRRAPDVTATAGKWLEGLSEEPFFLFLNYFDAHTPYQIPEKYASVYLDVNDPNLTEEEISVAIYDLEIAYQDHYFGGIIDFLKGTKQYDNTWIIVTADHGEMLREHGRSGHGFTLYEEVVNIPFFMKYPAGEQAPRQVRDRIQLTDVLPMILKRLGIAVPEGIQGGAPGELNHPVVSEVYPGSFSDQYIGDSIAIYDDDYKCTIRTHEGKQTRYLIDLARDPKEMSNLAEAQVTRTDRMEKALKGYLGSLEKSRVTGSEQQLDEETVEALKNLGYLQ